MDSHPYHYPHIHNFAVPTYSMISVQHYSPSPFNYITNSICCQVITLFHNHNYHKHNLYFHLQQTHPTPQSHAQLYFRIPTLLQILRIRYDYVLCVCVHRTHTPNLLPIHIFACSPYPCCILLFVCCFVCVCSLVSALAASRHQSSSSRDNSSRAAIDTGAMWQTQAAFNLADWTIMSESIASRLND